jgi:hypothetical protein
MGTVSCGIIRLSRRLLWLRLRAAQPNEIDLSDAAEKRPGGSALGKARQVYFLLQGKDGAKRPAACASTGVPQRVRIEDGRFKVPLLIIRTTR